MNKTQYDKFEITDGTHIQNFFMSAIQAGKIPSADTILATGIDELSRLVPARKGQSFEKIESIALIHDEGAPPTSLPAIIDVSYSYVKPKDVPLTFPISRQIANRWDTARVGSLLEQILDQLRIGNTKIGADIIEPISKLAVSGITADAKELQALQMDVTRLKSDITIHEMENGRLLANMADMQLKHEKELLKEQAKAKSYKQSTWIPRTENAEEAFYKLEEKDRYAARAILKSAAILYASCCTRILDLPDFWLRFDYFKQKPAYVLNYIHAMADALTVGMDMRKVTLQMVKDAKNNALQRDKSATIAVDEELGIDHTINWCDLHEDLYEPYYIKLCAIYSVTPPESLGL